MQDIFLRLKNDLISADLAFNRADWKEAIRVYEECARTLNEIWSTTFYPSDDIRKLTENLSTHLAYALTKEGKMREAVLAIENGKARYLNRLLAQKLVYTDEFYSHYGKKELQVIKEYLIMADRLTTLYSERSHPSLNGLATSNSRRLLAFLSRLSPEDLEKYSQYNKIFQILTERYGYLSNQIVHVLPRVLQGVDPESNPYYDPESYKIALGLIEWQNQLFQKYNLSDLADEHENQISRMEAELKELSSKLPESWLIPNWEEVEMALGYDVDSGGNYSNPGSLPIVYLLPSVHGSVVLIVAPKRREGVLAEIFTISLNITVPNLKDISLRISKLTRHPVGRASLWDRWKNNDLLGLLIKLWSLIMEPIIAALKKRNYESIILIPVGPATNLPLHAAKCSRDRSTPFANELISISYAPSARLITKARKIASQLKKKEPDFFGVCCPIPTNMQPLPFSEREVELISTRFWDDVGAGWMRPKILKGGDARRFLVSHNLSGEYYPIVHFACHSYFDYSDPLRGGIVLSADEPLSLGDIFKQTSKLRLSVLSCCDSGLTENDYINESIGFPGGLLAAGSAGVISTLWPVSDLGASLLMVRFYDAWFDEKLSPADALAKSQSWMIRSTIKEMLEYFSDHKFEKLTLPRKRGHMRL